MEFSEKIKLIRKHNHLTQEAFAQRINVSRKTVSGWENKRSYPDKHVMKLISEKFNIPFNDLDNSEDENIFDHNSLNNDKNEIFRKTIVYLLSIQIVLIAISYLSLTKFISAPVSSFFMIVNTLILIKFISKKNTKFFLKKNKSYIFIGSFHFSIGILSIMNYISHQGINLSLFYIFGMIIGTIIHIMLLTLAILTVYEYIKLYRKKLS